MPLAALWLALPAPVEAQRMVLLVRHAERADGGAGQMQSQADPELSSAGKARATRLASMLADAGIAAIYATEFRRTRDTGMALASRLGLTVQAVAARDTEVLVAKLRSDHADDVVLVIGHSNTVPAVIRALGGPEVTIADDAYGDLFVLVPATGALTRINF